MIVKTTEPCIQVYSGNFMERITIDGVKCKKHGAVCLETQRPPNAINMPEYKSLVILKPDEEYYHKTRHLFRVFEKK
jgi:aldose 1-epimerase